MKFLAASIALAVLATPAWAQTKPDQADTPPPPAAAHTMHARTTTHTVRHNGTMAKHHWKAKHSCCSCSCKTKMRHHAKHHVMKKTTASAASKPTTK